MSAFDLAAAVPVERRSRVLGADGATDALFLAVAVVIGLVGFHATYGGYGFLVGGILGLAVGIGIGFVTDWLGLPSAAAACGAVVVFFALGGAVALTGSGSALPTPATVRALARASIHGWRELLTVLPPVGDSGALLVIPYLLALTAGASGYLLARRARLALLPALPPACVLAASILFGTPVPASLTVQGVGFGAVALAWGSVRRGRSSVATAGGGRNPWRIALAVLLLAAAALGARVIGPRLPYAHMHDRVVLRNYVQPPFDPTAYSSPLASFRKYVTPPRSARKVLMTVTGLPRGARVRFATMDSYDGYAWGVTNGAPGTSGAFQRIGAQVNGGVSGRSIAVTIRVRDYSDVWLPDVGYVTRVRFGGTDAGRLQDDFRYNLVTGTGVVLSRVGSGDVYRIEATLPARPETKTLAASSPAGAPLSLQGVPPKVAPLAKAWAGSSSTLSFSQLQRIAARFRAGAYSDGSRSSGLQSHPGHGERRLIDFLDGAQLVGNDEQYAAAFALFANTLGFPARVVIGATPEADGTIRGVDVHAWDEVELSGHGWVPIVVTPPKSHRPNPNPPKVLDVDRTPTRVPPPNPAQPPSSRSVADTSSASANKNRASRHTGSGFAFGFLAAIAKYVGGPVAVFLLLAALVAGGKAARRQRRRVRGTPADRIAGGWKEVVDLAVDLGSRRPPAGTRRETARHLPHDLHAFALDADALIFGPVEPDNAAARSYWTLVDSARVGRLRALGQLQALRTRLSLRSLARSLT